MTKHIVLYHSLFLSTNTFAEEYWDSKKDSIEEQIHAVDVCTQYRTIFQGKNWLFMVTSVFLCLHSRFFLYYLVPTKKQYSLQIYSVNVRTEYRALFQEKMVLSGNISIFVFTLFIAAKN